MKKPYTLTAVVFLVFLFCGALYLLANSPTILRTMLYSWRTTEGGIVAHLDSATSTAEEALNTALRRGNFAIELYGGTLRLAGKNVSEDAASERYTVVRTDSGALTFYNLDLDTTEDPAYTVQEQAAWNEALAAGDIPLLYVACPTKTSRTQGGLPAGLTDWSVLNMSARVGGLRDAGVSVLDLRDAFEGLGDYSHLFFRTDHHWNIRGGLFAYQTIAQTLRDDYGLDIDPFYGDPANYDSEILDNWFLGSQGKRVGSLFAGADDFELLTPAFDTQFTFSIPSEQVCRTGTMEETILFPERVAERSYHGGNPYTYYAGGDFDLLTIENHLNPGGPRILVIRDSMACAVTPFLSLACSELILVDTRHYQGDVTQLALEQQPDVVLVLRS